MTSGASIEDESRQKLFVRPRTLAEYELIGPVYTRAHSHNRHQQGATSDQAIRANPTKAQLKVAILQTVFVQIDRL
jgi:hypothetical protein